MAARRRASTAGAQSSDVAVAPIEADSDASLLVRRSTEAQGLPVSVADAPTLDRVARLVRVSLPTDSATTGVKSQRGRC